MIDKSKQYRTRDGREVRIYATDGGDSYPIHGAIFYDDLRYGKGWRAREWTLHGGFNRNNIAHDLDLVETTPRIKRKVWVNVYDTEQQPVSWCFLNRQLADSAASSCKSARIACIPLTIDCEEGEGL